MEFGICGDDITLRYLIGIMTDVSFFLIVILVYLICVLKSDGSFSRNTSREVEIEEFKR